MTIFSVSVFLLFLFTVLNLTLYTKFIGQVNNLACSFIEFSKNTVYLKLKENQ